MVKHPPHILIITPESLYLMLTSRTGRTVLKTARALVIDELHALIDTKRGAHLMLSAARLDRLCKAPLQRIGLSATIEPLQTAADYLSPEPAHMVAPHMPKAVQIEVIGITQAPGRRKDPVWEELAEKVYSRCMQCRSVIAFSEGRRYAEKLAYYVNQLGGEDFARVHHGSLSKEQRQNQKMPCAGEICACSALPPPWSWALTWVTLTRYCRLAVPAPYPVPCSALAAPGTIRGGSVSCICTPVLPLKPCTAA